MGKVSEESLEAIVDETIEKVRKERLEAIINEAIEKARKVRCGLDEYVEGLEGWVEYVMEEIAAARESMELNRGK